MTRFRSALERIRRPVLLGSHRRIVSLRDAPPLVSFTFDDFPRSAFLAGGQILAARGARGTYYVAPGLRDTSNHLGEMFSERDLHGLVAAGHELASHTLSHASSWAMSTQEYEVEITRGEEALQAVVAAGPSGNFSFPYGHVTIAAKEAAAQHCRSCRSTLEGFHGPTADLNLLRANKLYSDSIPLSRVSALIEAHARPGRWLIFYTHDVRDSPSPFGCTPGYLEAAVRAAIDAGASVVTVAEALARIQAQGSPPPPRPNVLS